ncbi:MAG: efflux RND transporter periplasmic adaptor subunit [Bacteroidales bacterium]|jgi:HlyD family secretion protein|nr:efflux RND transporter periplasmic adaptor subunit [Bacteroidales bacterium]MDD4214434.1 efflux RND transporter periplasmic adaptor subunit [Bacteroidales bacterium]
MKKKKIIRFSIIGVVLIIILLAVGKKTGVIGKKTSIEVATEKVEKRTITETVSASGKIQPEVEIKISPDVSGEVVELNVKEGDKVKKGDLLAKIKPDIYESYYERAMATLNAQKAAEANAKARLSQVKAQFINSKATFERNEALWKQKVISQSEYDAALAAFEVAKEEVSAAEESYKAAQYNVGSTYAALKEAKENLTKTNIFSPVDGTISKLSIELGERVVGTSQFAGTEIMRIANLNEMEVDVDVNENDIVRVKKGDTAIIEVDAYLNRKFKGIVTEIANSAEVSGISADQVTNFSVKIRILQESYKDLIKPDKPELSPFRPGMSATVEIQTKTVYNVLSIPIQAVTVREDSNNVDNINETKEKNTNTVTEKKKNESQEKEIVFIYVDNKAKIKEVKTGIQDNMYIHIVSGLDENNEVITAPYIAITKTLKNDATVKKVDKKTLFSEKK